MLEVTSDVLNRECVDRIFARPSHRILYQHSTNQPGITSIKQIQHRIQEAERLRLPMTFTNAPAQVPAFNFRQDTVG